MLVTVRYKANDGKHKWQNSYSRYGKVITILETETAYVLYFDSDMFIRVLKKEAVIWKIEEE